MSHDPIDPLERFSQVRRDLEARWPESRISPTLSRIRTLTQYLGDPQRAFPVIHVGGTNGKTSTARMIEALLREFGLHTGLITSPHLSGLRERIRLDGEPIGVEAFLTVYDEVAPVLALADEVSLADDGPPLSFFEVMTGLAFAAFADAPVDVAIVEVGMGGAWDATNVADGQVAVITPIGMDHADYLGDTLEGIAAEKAGIIKPTSSVVLAAQPAEVAEVLIASGATMESAVALEGLDFGVVERVLAVGGQQLTLRGLAGEYPEILLPLFGEHQARNAALALAAVESFFGVGTPTLVPPGHRVAADPAPGHVVAGDAAPGAPGPPSSPGLPGAPSDPGLADDVPIAHGARQLDATTVRAGFGSVTSPGRLEIVRRAPTVVVDAAHNVPGAIALAAAVTESFAFSRLVAVIGVQADKDAAGILAALAPTVDEVVITRSSSPRALEVAVLAEFAESVLGAERVTEAARLDDALDLAIELAERGSPAGVGAGVLVTGSIALVGEARLLLGAESGAEYGATRADHAAPRGHAPEDLS